MDDLKYIPPEPATKSVRRVYVLDEALVKKVHEFGYENGCQTEVEAVRMILNRGLKSKEVR